MSFKGTTFIRDVVLQEPIIEMDKVIGDTNYQYGSTNEVVSKGQLNTVDISKPLGMMNIGFMKNIGDSYDFSYYVYHQNDNYKSTPKTSISIRMEIQGTITEEGIKVKTWEYDEEESKYMWFYKNIILYIPRTCMMVSSSQSSTLNFQSTLEFYFSSESIVGIDSKEEEYMIPFIHDGDNTLIKMPQIILKKDMTTRLKLTDDVIIKAGSIIEAFPKDYNEYCAVDVHNDYINVNLATIPGDEYNRSLRIADGNVAFLPYCLFTFSTNGVNTVPDASDITIGSIEVNIGDYDNDNNTCTIYSVVLKDIVATPTDTTKSKFIISSLTLEKESVEEVPFKRAYTNSKSLVLLSKDEEIAISGNSEQYKFKNPIFTIPATAETGDLQLPITYKSTDENDIDTYLISNKSATEKSIKILLEEEQNVFKIIFNDLHFGETIKFADKTSTTISSLNSGYANYANLGMADMNRGIVNFSDDAGFNVPIKGANNEVVDTYIRISDLAAFVGYNTDPDGASFMDRLHAVEVGLYNYCSTVLADGTDEESKRLYAIKEKYKELNP